MAQFITLSLSMICADFCIYSIFIVRFGATFDQPIDLIKCKFMQYLCKIMHLCFFALCFASVELAVDVSVNLGCSYTLTSAIISCSPKVLRIRLVHFFLHSIFLFVKFASIVSRSIVQANVSVMNYSIKAIHFDD